MVEEDRYCISILEQVSAATNALQSVAVELLDDHLAHCVADAVRTGGNEGEAKLKEASAAVARLGAVVRARRTETGAAEP